MPGGGGAPLPASAPVGRNPANGVVVYYSLKEKPATEVEIEFLDQAGKSIRKFTGRVRKPGEAPDAEGRIEMRGDAAAEVRGLRPGHRDRQHPEHGGDAGRFAREGNWRGSRRIGYGQSLITRRYSATARRSSAGARS